MKLSHHENHLVSMETQAWSNTDLNIVSEDEDTIFADRVTYQYFKGGCIKIRSCLEFEDHQVMTEISCWAKSMLTRNGSVGGESGFYCGYHDFATK